MRLITAIVIMGLSLGVAQLAAAQEVGGVIELEEVVVTATRTEVPLREIASSVTIIDSEMIEERHLRTVEAVLRDVPGLDIVQSGGPGGITAAFLRGSESDHTLVLVDGVQVNDPISGQFDLADLTADNIERVEIIRGPQSTLYGSDAIGGVIQIITKKGTGAATSSVLFEGGSFGSFRESIQVRGATERADYAFAVARFDTEGFSKASEKAGNAEKDGYQNTTLSSRVGLDLLRDVRLEWTTRYTDAQADLDAGFPFQDDPNLVHRSSSFVTATRLAAPIMKGWDQHLLLSLNQSGFEDTDTDTPSNNRKNDAIGKRLDWRHIFSAGHRDRLTIGYEHEFLSGKSQSAFGGFDEALTTNAGYVFNELRLTPFIINLGLRLDDNSRFGSETTYKAEAAYLAKTAGSKLRVAYGTGFHGPTLVDLFFPGSGNPDLEPERSRSIEAGFDQPLLEGKIRLAVTYFHARIENLIVFVVSDPVTFAGMTENVQQAQINGAELEIVVVPSDIWTLIASYSLTETKNLDTAKELLRRPRHKASGTLTVHPVKNLRVDLHLRHVGQRVDFGDVQLADYTLVNLAGTYDLTDATEVFARAENLFDQEYEEIAGYGTSGFAVYGGVKVTF